MSGRVIAAVVLAAGRSRRMGQAKLLMPVAGRAIVRHAVEGVLAGGVDEEVLEGCYATGRRLNEEEILIYNSFMSKRGWRDDETDEFIPAMIKQYGVRDDGSVLTDFDLIEMDEGRWYPEMWRDAWK